LTTCCFAAFGTDRLRCEEAMKTADRENPKRWANVPSNRALGAGGQNKSCSIQWAEKQEKLQPAQKCFFLTSTFIELTRQVELRRSCTSSRYNPAGLTTWPARWRSSLYFSKSGGYGTWRRTDTSPRGPAVHSFHFATFNPTVASQRLLKISPGAQG